MRRYPLLAATAIVAAGCGRLEPAGVSTPSPTAPAASTASATPAPASPAPTTPRLDLGRPDGACLLTAGEAGQAIGVPPASTAPGGDGKALACTYAGTIATGAGVAPYLSVEVARAPESLASFDRRRRDSPGTAVAGLGDGAYYTRLIGAQSRVLEVHAGTTSITLELLRPGADDATLLASLRSAAAIAISRAASP